MACALIVFSAVGAVWGWLRPVAVARPGAGDTLAIDPTSGAEFAGFVTFAVISGILGAIFGVIFYVVRFHTPVWLTLLWLLFDVTAGSLAFLIVGDFTAPHLADAALGDVGPTGAPFAPTFSPHTALAAGPFMAALAFWCAAFVD